METAIAHLHFVQEEIDAFCKANHITSLAVFGSVLRDDFREDSDIDLLVEFDPNVRTGLFAISEMQRELSDMFNRKVDFVPRNGLKEVIRDSVIASSRLIYSESKNCEIPVK